MEFICTSENCKHVFHPHSYVAFRHPGRAKYPKCESKAVKTEEGKEEWKEFNFMKNQSDFRNNRF